MKVCTIEDCGRQHKALGMCVKHYRQWQRTMNPIPTRVVEYASEEPSYAALHKRIFYKRGRAVAHDCVDCGNSANEWSYNHSGVGELEGFDKGMAVTYSVDIEQYEPRCIPCHRSKDRAYA